MARLATMGRIRAVGANQLDGDQQHKNDNGSLLDSSAHDCSSRMMTQEIERAQLADGFKDADKRREGILKTELKNLSIRHSPGRAAVRSFHHPREDVMQRTVVAQVAAAVVVAMSAPLAWAQQPNVTLHVDTRWKSCALHLDSSLSQSAWHQFTQDVGVVAYFRPLTDARPLGAGNFEVSLMQWGSKVDETSSAWNDTFVHPDSMHWLTEGGALAIPGLMVRAGISSRIDAGAYFTKNVESNYGLWGGQLQYNLLRDANKRFAGSARLSVVSVYGPDDVDVMVYGLDLMASGTYPLGKGFSVSPYGGVSTMLSTAHEKSPVVALNDEHTVGAMGTVGVLGQYSFVRLAAEYNVAAVNALSFRLGFGL